MFTNPRFDSSARSQITSLILDLNLSTRPMPPLLSSLEVEERIQIGVNHIVQVKFITERTKSAREFANKIVYLNSHPEEVSRDENRIARLR